MKVLAVYFCSLGGCNGWGNVAADFEIYPPNEKDIRELEKKIADETSCTKAVVVNLIPLREKKDAASVRVLRKEFF